MAKKTFELIWHPPAAEADASGATILESATASPVRHARDLTRRLGPTVDRGAWRERPLPDLGYVEVVGASSPKEELLALLALGAEVEQALLVQYLYAVQSLDPNGTSETQILHDSIRAIALQEMAHLVTVQNLLLMVGGPEYLHIGRDVLRAKSRNNPLPFALEPVSELTISEYVLVEAPATLSDPALAALVAKLKKKVKEEAGIEPHRVGAFYTQIYWLLQPTDAPVGTLQLAAKPAEGRKPGWHLKPGDYSVAKEAARYLAEFGEWKGNNGPVMLIRPDPPLPPDTPPDKMAEFALGMVAEVMEQGEGAMPGESTHFEGFVAALDLMGKGGISLLGLPRTPYAGDKPKEAPVSTPLTKDYTKLWANLFDVRYTMLMLDIGLTLATPRTNPDRATLLNWAFVSMRPMLLQLMGQLTSPTLSAIEPCGPTFGLLYQDFPGVTTEGWKRYQSLLEAEAKIVAKLAGRPELATDLDGSDLLDSIKSNGAVRVAFVASKLGGAPVPTP